MTYQHTWCSNIRLHNESERVQQNHKHAIVQINLTGVALDAVNVSRSIDKLESTSYKGIQNLKQCDHAKNQSWCHESRWPMEEVMLRG